MVLISDYISKISETIACGSALVVADSLKKNIKNLEEVIKNGDLVHDDDRVNHEVKETLRSIQSGYAALENLLPKGLVSELISSLGQLADIKVQDTVVAKFNDDSRGNNDLEFKKSYDQFRNECAKVDKLIDGTLDTLDDHQHQIYQKIKMQNDGIQGLAKSSEAAAMVLFKNPKDAIAEENLSSIIGHFTNQIRELQKTLISDDSVFSAHYLLGGASKLLIKFRNEFRCSFIRIERLHSRWRYRAV